MNSILCQATGVFIFQIRDFLQRGGRTVIGPRQPKVRGLLRSIKVSVKLRTGNAVLVERPHRLQIAPGQMLGSKHGPKVPHRLDRGDHYLDPDWDFKFLFVGHLVPYADPYTSVMCADLGVVDGEPRATGVSSAAR